MSNTANKFTVWLENARREMCWWLAVRHHMIDPTHAASERRDADRDNGTDHTPPPGPRSAPPTGPGRRGSPA